MSYTGESFDGSCYNCGRDKTSVYQQKGNVGCVSCKEKYFQEIADEEKSQRPTLRDQFACSALQGLLSNLDFSLSEEEYAHQAYLIADKMLAEREKK